MKKQMIFLVMALLFLGLASAGTVFQDNFNDGNYNLAPVWTSGVNVTVIGGALHHDGWRHDESDRYWSIMNSNVSFVAGGDLEISYKGLLKSKGNPQEGRAIDLALVHPGGNRYSLRLHNGYTTGNPIDQSGIALSYAKDGVLHDYIVTDFTPEMDRYYNIRTARKNGVWSLYVDGSLVGTHSDDLGLADFYLVHMPMVGSVVVDDIRIEAPGECCEGCYTKEEVDSKLGSLQKQIDTLKSQQKSQNASLKGLKDSFYSFKDKILKYLRHLPENIRKPLLCGYMNERKYTKYADLGLECIVKKNATSRVCICKSI